MENRHTLREGIKQMKCQFCGRELPDGKTGKRPREYCNDACKQARYRQRHRRQADSASLQRELSQARLRISELERLVRLSPLARQASRPKVDVEPVELWAFSNRHGVAVDDTKRIIRMGMLRPMKQADGTELLDADGQRTFYQAYHHSFYGWHDCPDCPHDEVPLIT
jgi:hypothetical protein